MDSRERSVTLALSMTWGEITERDLLLQSDRAGLLSERKYVVGLQVAGFSAETLIKLSHFLQYVTVPDGFQIVRSRGYNFHVLLVDWP